MTRSCLKEAFIENQLDKFQPRWREGQDITAETKKKIKEYAATIMPDELIESDKCITDYSIWHMAKKIRLRENLPKPTRSNGGRKVGERKPEVRESKPSEEKTSDPPTRNDPMGLPTEEYCCDSGNEGDPEAHANILKVLHELKNKYGYKELVAALLVIEAERLVLDLEVAKKLC